MLYDDFKLRDYLLPEQDEMEDFSFCEESESDIEHEVLPYHHMPHAERGPFSDSPERAARWLAHVSEHYIAA